MALESWSEMLFQKLQRRQQDTNQKASAKERQVFWGTAKSLFPIITCQDLL